MFWALGLKILYVYFELGIIEKHKKDIGGQWKGPQLFLKVIKRIKKDIVNV
jgi:hypothetical protein